MNKSYWKRRNEQLLSKSINKGDKWYKELIESYLMSLKQVERELEGFYSSIDTITLNNAKKHLKGSDLIAFKRNINKFLNEDVRNEWKNELLKLSKRYRVSRLQGLQISIRQELELLGKKELDGLEKLSKEIYEDNYYQNLYEVTKSIGVTKVFDKVDARKIEILNKKGWADDDKNFSERIWGRQDKVNRFLNKELTQSIKLGEDPQKVINKMAKTFKTNKSRAGNLILTESAYYTSESQSEAYKDLNVEKYQIVATIDDVTSDICQDMDLLTFDMSEYEINVTAPPFHPRCRTVTIPYYQDNYTERFVRDNEGETYYIDKNIKYSEWKEKYVK